MSKHHMNHGSTMAEGATSFEDRVHSLKDSVRGLADMGSTRASELKDRVVSAKETAMSAAQTYRAHAETWIKGNPLAAVGIAFGIGYVAMRIVRR
jgi:ElaB/YqjD/DUF883 family membrane-anchored ribosome-binding protein